MIKLNASFSKKVPAEQDYSSKSFMACVEVELPTGATPQELQQKIHETFDLVKRSVEDELADQTTQPGPEAGRLTGAFSALHPCLQQADSVHPGSGKSKEMTLAALNAESTRLYGVESIYNLSKPDASKFVDVLKQAA
jgi:hypothetical protein